MSGFHPHSGEDPVGDLRCSCELIADANCRELTFELAEGTMRYVFHVPGPAAAADQAPSIEVRDSTNTARPALRAASAQAWRARAGEPVRVGAQNLDDLLELDIGGGVVCSLEIPASDDQRSGVALRCAGGRVQLRDAMVYRDIYYTSAYSKVTEIAIPDGSYFMMGDNTQYSSDSRDWTLVRYMVRQREDPSAPPLELRGNWDRRDNPVKVVGGEQGTDVFLVDQWGERHEFLQDQAQQLAPLEAPFVPRSAILGRALCVFWPLLPQLSVYRWKWIH